MDELESFRELLRERLQVRGELSRLSERSGLSTAVLGRWRDGIGRPTDKNLKKLAPALGVEYETLARMCGYLPGEPEAIDLNESELVQRSEQFKAALRNIPRVFWSVATEASIRMAEAMPDLSVVTSPGDGRVTGPDRDGNEDEEGPSSALQKCQPVRRLVGVLA